MRRFPLPTFPSQAQAKPTRTVVELFGAFCYQSGKMQAAPGCPLPSMWCRCAGLRRRRRLRRLWLGTGLVWEGQGGRARAGTGRHWPALAALQPSRSMSAAADLEWLGPTRTGSTWLEQAQVDSSKLGLTGWTDSDRFSGSNRSGWTRTDWGRLGYAWADSAQSRPGLVPSRNIGFVQVC